MSGRLRDRWLNNRKQQIKGGKRTMGARKCCSALQSTDQP
jgi:hypothetical protein